MDDQTAQVLLTGVVTLGVTTLTGLAGVGIALMRQKLGLQAQQNDLLVDKNMRDKLQATLVTAIGIYATEGKDKALSYVVSQAADTMQHFNLDPAAVSDLIVNKAAAWTGVPANSVNPAAWAQGTVAAPTVLSK